MKDLKNQHVNCPYEVGDGFFTKNSTNPEVRWPGTKWTQIKDMFILAAGDNYEVDATGGEAEHTLTVAEMPSHNHDELHWGNGSSGKFGVNGSGSGTWRLSYSGGASETNFYSGYTGDSKPHNNMPPYLVRYYWERTA